MAGETSIWKKELHLRRAKPKIATPRSGAWLAPKAEGGKLVGVLSRSAVQRRLAEDDPPQETES
jgi:hypothetical protein